jgi:hypothetical protein
MSEQYFLGREPDGDESGVYPEDVYDGKLWCVDPDEPEPEPQVVACIESEEQAAEVLKLLQDRARLRAANEEMLAALVVVETRMLQALTIRIKLTGITTGAIADELKQIQAAIAKGKEAKGS